ncbi:hypothetical protein JOC36_001646 [Weissella uvarum]|uniref:hypothetical protein n=1 Tax=Weissella uvarum TaxID=1479233 RepID=UPI001961D91E|nr:hypothetical protein [Weissella uvarum]MBM7618046.1 hypothetical protein [Weissella uvarum]MCM0595097.1 hypothetical protein [Weissella uvarum]
MNKNTVWMGLLGSIALFGGSMIAENVSADSKPVKLNAKQTSQVNRAFYNWAGQRAQKGNMAVSDWYFDHGAAGSGDWYAKTTQGELQIQDYGKPGRQAFKQHALGGVVFYTDKSGRVGKQNLHKNNTLAQNYSMRMNFKKPVTKYVLADTGTVYELKLDDKKPVSVTTGFGEYTDNGKKNNYIKTNEKFVVSKDKAAQKKLKQLIKEYR